MQRLKPRTSTCFSVPCQQQSLRQQSLKWNCVRLPPCAMLRLSVPCARRALPDCSAQGSTVCQERHLQSDRGCPCAPCCGILHPLETPPDLHMPQPFTWAPAASSQRRLTHIGCWERFLTVFMLAVVLCTMSVSITRLAFMQPNECLDHSLGNSPECLVNFPAGGSCCPAAAAAAC